MVIFRYSLPLSQTQLIRLLSQELGYTAGEGLKLGHPDRNRPHKWRFEPTIHYWTIIRCLNPRFLVRYTIQLYHTHGLSSLVGNQCILTDTRLTQAVLPQNDPHGTF